MVMDGDEVELLVMVVILDLCSGAGSLALYCLDALALGFQECWMASLVRYNEYCGDRLLIGCDHVKLDR